MTIDSQKLKLLLVDACNKVLALDFSCVSDKHWCKLFYVASHQPNGNVVDRKVRKTKDIQK